VNSAPEELGIVDHVKGTEQPEVKESPAAQIIDCLGIVLMLFAWKLHEL